jgi:hypothetical protein
MRVLCPACGFHHEVVRVLDDGSTDEGGKDHYQVVPLATCDRSWLSDTELLEARARFGQDVIIPDDDVE